MSAPHSALGRVLRVIRHIEDGALIALLTAMIVIAISQIVMRNFLGTGIAWGDPLLRILVLWVGLAGAIVATRENHHISINVLAHLLPGRAQAIAQSLAALFTALICAIIAYHSARFVYSEFEVQTIAFASIPAWWCQVILPLAFGVMCLRFTALSFQHFNQSAGDVTL